MKIKIKVVPQSGRQKIILDKNGIIKCYLISPAHEGKANKELVRFLADSLSIPQRNVDIVSGLLTPTKILDIAGYDSETEIKKVLGFDVQENLFDENS